MEKQDAMDYYSIHSKYDYILHYLLNIINFMHRILTFYILCVLAGWLIVALFPKSWQSEVSMIIYNFFHENAAVLLLLALVLKTIIRTVIYFRNHRTDDNSTH